MGLCKCPKRKVTNLFCFEHDVNVCEDCLVSDHERCIVQSYVQWLQDSDYNPICILCKNLLKDEPTVRLACYDVFHWSCLDNYAKALPANTAPAGYQCPKCKECIFPPSKIVSPVVEILKQKLESVEWSRVGLGQSLFKNDETINMNDDTDLEQILHKPSTKPNSNSLEDESNGFVIVSEQNRLNNQEKLIESIPAVQGVSSSTQIVQNNHIDDSSTNDVQSSQSHQIKHSKIDMVMPLASENVLSHNRNLITGNQDIRRSMEPSYDPSLGIVLNINNLDRDTGDYKYQRRPVFEWFNRWLKSRQMSSGIRMTRQKKNLFMIILIFLGFFTLILIMTRLGEMSTENDPAFDPLNNPNIHVE